MRISASKRMARLDTLREAIQRRDDRMTRGQEDLVAVTQMLFRAVVDWRLKLHDRDVVRGNELPEARKAHVFHLFPVL